MFREIPGFLNQREMARGIISQDFSKRNDRRNIWKGNWWKKYFKVEEIYRRQKSCFAFIRFHVIGIPAELQFNICHESSFNDRVYMIISIFWRMLNLIEMAAGQSWAAIKYFLSRWIINSCHDCYPAVDKSNFFKYQPLVQPVMIIFDGPRCKSEPECQYFIIWQIPWKVQELLLQHFENYFVVCPTISYHFGDVCAINLRKGQFYTTNVFQHSKVFLEISHYFFEKSNFESLLGKFIIM